MNREEAILLLHDMKDTYDEIHENTNGDLGYEQMTALDMAIEALKWQDRILTQIEDIVLKEHGERREE